MQLPVFNRCKNAITCSLVLVLVLIGYRLSAQNMGVKMTPGTLPNSTLDVNGATSLREGTALTLVNGINNDINLATEYSFYRITGPTAAFSITGFNNGQNGRILTVVNATTQIMTVSGSIGSIAANQLLTGGATFTVSANGSATFQYNTTLTKWVLLSTTGSPTTSNDWSLTGNSGTTAGTNFVGTTDAQDLVFKTNSTEGMRLTTTTRHLGINSTTPDYKIQVDESGSGDADIVTRLYNNNNTNWLPSFQMHLSNGTKASPSTVTNGITLGAVRWGGYDGSNFNDANCNEINSTTTENWTTAAHGASINFRTIPNGSTVTINRMIIDQTGYIGIGTTTPAQKLEVSNGNISLSNTTGTAGELRFAEPSAGGSNYTSIKAGTQSADIAYMLPTVAPTAGQLLSSDASGNMSWATGAGTTLAVVKTVDESVANSTVQQNDDVFAFTVAPNSTYILDGTLMVLGNSISMSYVSPSGTYKIYGSATLSGSYNSNQNNGSTAGYSLSSGTSLNSINLSGTIITGVTGGTFQFRWAQSASSATATVIQAYSFIRLYKAL
jgi:hypothetical protein